MSFSWSNLWGNLFPGSVTPVPRSTPEPDASCFAKGVAQSIITGGEGEWEVDSTLLCPGMWEDWDCILRHRTLDAAIWMRWRRGARGEDNVIPSPYPGCDWLRLVHYTGPNNKADLHLIARALEQRPMYTFKRMIEHVAETEAKRKATHEHFTKLGCPFPASELPPRVSGWKS